MEIKTETLHDFHSYLFQCDVSTSLGNTFQLFHHHLIYMFENITSRAEKRVFNSLTGTATVMDFLHEKYGL